MYIMNVKRPNSKKQTLDKVMQTLINDFVLETPKRKMPRTNIIEHNDRFEVQLTLPGFTKSDVGIEMEQGVLTIKSKKETAKENTYSKQEFDFSGFEKRVRLSKSIDTSNITASMENGILSISLGKKEEAKEKPARHIEIA